MGVYCDTFLVSPTFWLYTYLLHFGPPPARTNFFIHLHAFPQETRGNPMLREPGNSMLRSTQMRQVKDSPIQFHGGGGGGGTFMFNVSEVFYYVLFLIKLD